MTTTTVAVSKLVHSPRNVRQPSEDDDTHDLEATILELGLINPLTAHPMPRGRYGVVAGGRRLLALQRLITRGDLPKAHAVDIVVRDETDAKLTELSFAENAVRLALPAVTEFQTYSRLIDEGANITAVAHRYQVSELHVRQRMRLGQLHPDILAALSAGRMTLDIAKAYAATADQELQKRIFDQSPVHAYEIRAAMRRDAANAGVDRMIELVGVDAYTDAGGRGEEDLFSQGEVRILDIELLRKLYDERLAVERADLGLPPHVTLQFSAEGIGHRVDIVDEPTDEQHERLIAIDRELLELDLKLDRTAELDQDGPAPRWTAVAGGDQDEVDRIVQQRRKLTSESDTIRDAMGWPEGPLIALAAVADGRLTLTGFHRPYGWQPDAVVTNLPSEPATTRAATPRPAPAAAPIAPAKPIISGFRSDRAGYSGVYRQPEDVAREEFGLTKDGVDAMRSHHRQILQAEMLGDPTAQRLAHRYLIFVLARGMIRKTGPDDYRRDPGELGVDRLPSHDHDPVHVRAELAAQPGGATVGEAIERLRAADWMIEPDVGTAFRRFATVGHIDLERAAACVATAMLSRSLGTPGFRVGVHEAIAELINVASNVRDHWTPDEAFFARLPKNRKLDAIRFVDEAVARRVASLSTDELNRAAAAIMSADREAVARYELSREAAARARGWVPPYLSFEAPEDPAAADQDEDEACVA